MEPSMKLRSGGQQPFEPNTIASLNACHSYPPALRDLSVSYILLFLISTWERPFSRVLV